MITEEGGKGLCKTTGCCVQRKENDLASIKNPRTVKNAFVMNERERGCGRESFRVERIKSRKRKSGKGLRAVIGREVVCFFFLQNLVKFIKYGMC